MIEKIEFYKADYTFLPVAVPLENNLEIKSVKKYGTAIYQVDVEGSGLMQLSQGYEDGWIAINTE